MQEYFNIKYEFSKDTVLDSIETQSSRQGGKCVFVADGNVLVNVHKDNNYRNIINNSLFSICDSSWVPLYLKHIYGFKPEQYSGSDIFKDITSSRKYRMAFLGSSREVLDALRGNLAKIDGRIEEMLFMDLPFAAAEDFDFAGIGAKVNEFDPDIIWVSLGAPKQEIFSHRLAPFLKRGVIIPVGAVFNFRAGLGIRRAPGWMVRCHMEFIYRIFSEPSKQLKRVWGILRYTPAIIREEKRKAA